MLFSNFDKKKNTTRQYGNKNKRAEQIKQREENYIEPRFVVLILTNETNQTSVCQTRERRGFPHSR